MENSICLHAANSWIISGNDDFGKMIIVMKCCLWYIIYNNCTLTNIEQTITTDNPVFMELHIVILLIYQDSLKYA